jgi:hypothetical protein
MLQPARVRHVAFGVREAAGTSALFPRNLLKPVGRPHRLPGYPCKLLIQIALLNGGGGSRTRVRKRAYERPYRLSPAWNFAARVKAGPNPPRLVRLISPFAYGPKARGQPTFMTLRPTAVGGPPGERVA